MVFYNKVSVAPFNTSLQEVSFTKAFIYYSKIKKVRFELGMMTIQIS